MRFLPRVLKTPAAPWVAGIAGVLLTLFAMRLFARYIASRNIQKLLLANLIAGDQQAAIEMARRLAASRRIESCEGPRLRAGCSPVKSSIARIVATP